MGGAADRRRLRRVDRRARAGGERVPRSARRWPPATWPRLDGPPSRSSPAPPTAPAACANRGLTPFGASLSHHRAAPLHEQHVAPRAVQAAEPLRAGRRRGIRPARAAARSPRSRGRCPPAASTRRLPPTTRRAPRATPHRRRARGHPRRRTRSPRRRPRTRIARTPARAPPSPAAVRRAVAARRCLGMCAASHRSQSGTSVSNVASPVAMPSA